MPFLQSSEQTFYYIALPIFRSLELIWQARTSVHTASWNDRAHAMTSAVTSQNLQRIHELTVQGLNGTLSCSDSDAIQGEINMSLLDIDRLAESVNYNGTPPAEWSSWNS